MKSLVTIIGWKPFRAIHESGEEYRFTCPRCKSHNAVRAPHSSGKSFLEGHYKCADCDLSEYEQRVIGGKIEVSPVTYYSDCFTRHKQPTLFDN